MKKVVIIGPPGAGKTTLATKLGKTLKIRVLHLDRLLWKRGWQAIPGDERIDILQALVPETRWPDGRWIMEGTYLQSSGPRLEAADTIIFLDTHPLICLGRIMKRHYDYNRQSRRDLPEGCVDRLTFSRIWKVLAFPFKEHKELEHILRSYPPEKIINLSSPRQVKDFLGALKEGRFDHRETSINARGEWIFLEARQLLTYAFNTISALIFFTYICLVLLPHVLSPRVIFSLRARLH